MPYRLFIVNVEGFIFSKLFIQENDAQIYEATIKGILSKTIRLKPSNQSFPIISIKKLKWLKSKRVVHIASKKVCEFSRNELYNSFELNSAYGYYSIKKNSLVNHEYTISNSTTEIAKLSRKGIFKKEYGIAIHKNEHVEFILAIITYIIFRIIQKEKSAAAS